MYIDLKNFKDVNEINMFINNLTNEQIKEYKNAILTQKFKF